MDLTTESSAPSAALKGFWGAFYVSRPFLLELFVLSNLAFLILDVYVAHAFNDFAHWAEWIPIYFAGAGSLALIVSVVPEYRRRTEQSRWLGHVVARAPHPGGSRRAPRGDPARCPLLSGAVAETGLWDAVRYGPPVFAPLLFVDLATLAALGLWDLGAKLLSSSPA